MIGRTAATLLLTLAAAGPAQGAPRPAPAPASSACDGACLKGLATAFMDGLANRGASARLPWAERVRYAENGVAMMVDDGIWATVTAYAPKPLVVADPATGSVAWFGSIDEHGQPAFFALRLKADGRRIAEAEAVIRRKEGRPPFGDPTAFAHDPAFGRTLPAAARLPRERMAALVQGWFNSVAGNDGTVLTSLAADCAKAENGVATTSGDFGPARLAAGCEAQLKLGLFRDVDRVRGLAFPVVDEARGVVIAVGTRDYSGRATSLTAADGRTFAPDARFPHSYAFVAAFKLEGGAIARIEEVSSDVPYLMPTWQPSR